MIGENLLSRALIVERFYGEFDYVKHLAVGLLKFKDYMKQYVNLNDLQDDIFKHIRMIVDGCNKNKCNDSAIGEYLHSFCYHFDEKRIEEIFDADFMYKLKDAILGENKKISCWYQMVFLRDVCSFCHDHNNIVCCVVFAFRRKEYGKLIKEIFLAILSIVASPVLCPYNNLRDSKYLFCITGSSKKVLTFDNWYFFNSEEKICDIYNAKNFNISNISLWFFIKYIFGFERIIRLDEFDDKDVDLKLTVESISSKNEEENKIIDRQQIPISEYTNEYSPLRYF